MGYWTGKAAIVTGGSSGLGLAIAGALVDAGAHVAIVARSPEKLEAAAGKLRSRGAGQVLTVAADITRAEDVDQMVATVLERFGKLDVLVNCAGSSARGDVMTTSVDEFRRLMELNLFALVHCTRTALPHLLATQGHVVNIGSLAAKSASRFMGGYAASKFAVAAYSQQLRLELSEQGLHVLLVCPGPIARDDDRVYPGSEDLPVAARKAGAGVKLKLLDPTWLANRILTACERRDAELVVPAKARLLFALAQLSPRWGDWLLRKMTT
jgi:short-subunit dehydrogenase